MMRVLVLLVLLLLGCQEVTFAEPQTEKNVPPVHPQCPGGADGALQRGEWVKIFDHGAYPYRLQGACIVR